MAKYELWINLYPNNSYVPYSSKEKADKNAEPNRIKCCKIEWEDPTRVADYLVRKGYEFGTNEPMYLKQTHPIGSQPEGSVMVPGSERNATE